MSMQKYKHNVSATVFRAGRIRFHVVNFEFYGDEYIVFEEILFFKEIL